jgi:transcriptional regulator with XRE-family HTH domain
MDGKATQRTGELIRAARVERGLGVVELGRLAGVSAATVSKIERGRRPAVTLAMADRILAALGLRLHVETVPLWADIDTAIAEAAKQSLAERMQEWPFDFAALVSRLDGIPYLLDGLTSAAVQGAPVKAEEFEFAVPRDDEVLDRLTFLLHDFMARRGEGLQSRDPREPGSEHYLCVAGRFRIRLIDRYQPVLWADIDPLPAAEATLPSINGLPLPPPLTRVRVAVVPLAEIQTVDGYPKRIIERMAVRR